MASEFLKRKAAGRADTLRFQYGEQSMPEAQGIASDFLKNKASGRSYAMFDQIKTAQPTMPTYTPPTTPNKISEGEFNRSSAMQTEYGNYRNYLNGIKDTESPAYINAQLKRLETETAPQYDMPQYPGADADVMQDARGKWGEWATAKRKSEDSNAAQNLKNAQTDTKLAGTYTSTKNAQSDLDMVRSILMDRMTPTGERNISEYKAAIASKYGVSPSEINNTPRDREDYYQGLEDLRDQLQTQVAQNTETIAAGGYDYQNLSKYEQSQSDKAESQKKVQDAVRFAGTHPVAASAQSVVASAVQPIEFLQMAIDGNPYNMDATNFTNAVRGAVAKDIEQNTDWGKTGAFLYNVGMSVADSAMLISTLGGASSVFMGAKAASQRANEILNKGGSMTQAVIGGIASGAAEAVFEKFSVDRLLAAKDITGIKSLLKSVAQQAGTEASEEINTEIANILLDAVIMGNGSDYRNLVADLMLGGATPEEAQRIAIMENIKQVALSGLGGAISGGVMGGFAGAMNYQSAPTQTTQEQSSPTSPLNSTDSVVEPTSGIPTTATAQAQQSAPQTVTAQAAATPAKVETAAFSSVGAADAGFVGDTERGFSRNIATDKNMNPELQEDFQLDPEMYFRLGNKETLSKAQEIFSTGISDAQITLERALEAAKNGSKLAPEMVPLSRMVSNALVQNGDIVGARRILSDIAVELTQSGQLGQAAAILRNADPVSVEQTVQKAMDKINEQLEKAGRGKKWQAKLTDAEIQQIYNTDFTQEGAFEAIYDQIARRLGAEMGSTLWEKLTEVRRMAMLLNPKTQVRNVVGNVPLAVERKVAERISGAVQGGLIKAGIMDAKDRTRTAVVSRESKDIARQLYEQNLDSLKNSGNKWDMNNMLREYRKYFGDSAAGQSADAVRTFTYQLLEMGDTPFLRSAFVDSAAQYIQAQGYTSLDQVPQNVIDFATQNALEATFRDTSSLSKFINQMKANGGVSGASLDILFPFVSTPVNIARRTIDYSPMGLIKALNDARTGKGAAAVVDDLAKAFTGTSVFALGYILRKMGVITGGADDDKDKRAWDKDTGGSPFSFLGKVAYDWMQPFGSQLAAGAEIYDATRDNPSLVSAVLQGLYAGGDTVLNMTVFQNILDILKGYGSPTENVLTEIMTSGVSQFAPSLFGALARTIDDTVRSSYTGEGAVKDTAAQTQAKVPFASQNLPASVDIWGRERKRVENPLLRGAQEFINPANVNTGQQTEVDRALAELYEQTKDKAIFPRVAPNNITIRPPKGEAVEKVLTGEERARYQTTQGQSAFALIEAFTASDIYDTLTPEQRADVIEDIHAFSEYKAINEVAKSLGLEHESDWGDEMSLSDFGAYQAYKTALSDAKKGENYDILDALIEAMGGQPKEMQDAILDLDGMGKLSQAFKVGISSEQYYDLNDQWRIINAKKDKTATEKATEYAVWLEGRSELTPIQRTRVKDFMTFYSMAPASAAQYERLRQNGLSTKTAEKIYSNISNLLPEKGKPDVSNAQKYKVILTSGLPEKDQRAALKAYMPESTYEKMESAFDYGVGAKLFVDFNNKKSDLTGTGEIKAPLKKWAIQNGMTTKQFNQLWLLYYPKD